MDDGVSQNRHGRQYEVEYAESEREAPSIRFGPDLSQGQKECRLGRASGRRPDAFARGRLTFGRPGSSSRPRAQSSSAQFGAAPGGLQLLQTLFLDVKLALMHGLQEIFFWSAVIMGASILLHVFLRRVPLRGKPTAEDKAAAAAASVH